MKTKILILLAFIIGSRDTSFSQIIAGSGSAGLIISNPLVNLSNASIGNTVSCRFDLNCDGHADMRLDLIKGPTAIDGENEALLYVLNPLFQICADTGSGNSGQVHYFNLGDTLISPHSAHWSVDTMHQLGNYGCMLCSGPAAENNVFIAYRNTSTAQTGWIKVSFNLSDFGNSATPVTVSVPAILSPCSSTSFSSGIDDSYKTNTYRIFPNPVRDYLNVETESKSCTAMIYDNTGQLILQMKNIAGKTRMDFSCLPNGMYFIQMQSGDNTTSTKFIKE